MKTDLLVGFKCFGNNNSHELCQTDVYQFLEVASPQRNGEIINDFQSLELCPLFHRNGCLKSNQKLKFIV